MSFIINSCCTYVVPEKLSANIKLTINELKITQHAWKACIRQKRIPSSNLGHSADKVLKISKITPDFWCFFCVYKT